MVIPDFDAAPKFETASAAIPWWKTHERVAYAPV